MILHLLDDTWDRSRLSSPTILIITLAQKYSPIVCSLNCSQREPLVQAFIIFQYRGVRIVPQRANQKAAHCSG